MSKVEEKPYIVQNITEQDMERVLHYLREHFYGDEPLNQYLNSENNEYTVASDRGSNSTNSIKEGLSVMAVRPSNEIIGVIINKNFIMGEEIQGGSPENNPNFVKIRTLAQKLEDEMVDKIKLQSTSEKEISIRIISVRPDWRNKRVAYALLERTREIAKQNKFSQIRCICSSAYSARILEKLGFNCVHAISYEDYKEHGKPIFKPKPPHTHIRAMIFRL